MLLAGAVAMTNSSQALGSVPRCPAVMDDLFFRPVGAEWHAGRLRSFHSGDAVTLYSGRSGMPKYRMTTVGECTELPAAVRPSRKRGFYGRGFEKQVRIEANRQVGRDGIFIGDSIVTALRGLRYPETQRIWSDIAGSDSVLNAAVPGDRTGHAISLLDLIRRDARLVAIQIGTNNHNAAGTFRLSAAETAEGIARIVAEARVRAPGARIVLIAIPPTTLPVRHRHNQRTNELIRTLADGKHVFFVDPGPLIDPADPGISHDGLHLRPHGQYLWYGALTPTLRAILDGEEPPEFRIEDHAASDRSG